VACKSSNRPRLSLTELAALEEEIEALISESEGISSGFIVETPEKLRRIAHHFRTAWFGIFACTRLQCPQFRQWLKLTDLSDPVFHPSIGNSHEATRGGGQWVSSPQLSRESRHTKQSHLSQLRLLFELSLLST
jgi:hypothetical protein